QLRLANLKGLGAGETAWVDTRKVEVTVPPIAFKPRLGTQPSVDLDRKNDGWFKVEFVPPVVGDIKLRVQNNDAPDNFYNHKFNARDEVPPELENLKPDVDAMRDQLASGAGAVLARIPDEAVRDRVRAALPKGKEGARPLQKGESPDDRLKLYFEIGGKGTGADPTLIPECMITLKPDIQPRKPGDLESLWDKCVHFNWNKDTNRKVLFAPMPLEVSLVDGKDSSVGWRIPAVLLAVLV